MITCKLAVSTKWFMFVMKHTYRKNESDTYLHNTNNKAKPDL